MAVSWRDALKQAAAPPAPPARPAAIDPGALSPALQALQDERKRMEAKLSELTGAGGQGTAPDPRFAVAPLAQRRAELARWAASREAVSRKASEWQRAAPAPGEPDPMPADRSAAGRPPAEPASADRTPAKTSTDRSAADRSTVDRLGADRSVAGRMLAALASSRAEPGVRPTPGATPGGTAASADAFTALRDALRREPTRRDASGFTDRAFDRITDVVAKPRKAEEALDRARKAIGDDWRERARKAVPDLVKELPFSPRVKEALTIAVGSIDDLTDRAERLRDTLRDARELKAADDAGDDKRRDHALERLKAKRQENA